MEGRYIFCDLSKDDACGGGPAKGSRIAVVEGDVFLNGTGGVGKDSAVDAFQDDAGKKRPT